MGKLAAMIRTLSKDKKPRTAGILFLFGVVTVVIGCARAQKTSFSDFWPKNGLSFKKSDDKAIETAESKKSAAAGKVSNQKVETADAKAPTTPVEKKSWGSRLVKLVGGEDSKPADEATDSRESGLAYDPFLSAEQRVASLKPSDTARKDYLTNGLHASDRGKNPFVPSEKESSKQPAVAAKGRAKIEQANEPEFARRTETPAGPANQRGDNPAFADSFNEQMDRLRDEMNESNSRTLASAAPDQDFDVELPNLPEEAAPPAVKLPNDQREELPEFTKFANTARQPQQPQAQVAKNEPLAPWDVQPTSAPAPTKEVAPKLSAPAVETVVESTERPATTRKPMPTITPRRPVQRSNYTAPGYATISENQTPPAKVQISDSGVAAKPRNVVTSDVAPAQRKNEFVSQVSSEPAPKRETVARTQVEVADASPTLQPQLRTNSATVNHVATPAPVVPATVERSVPAVPYSVVSRDMIVPTSQIQSRAQMRRQSQMMAATDETKSTVTQDDSNSQPASTGSPSVSSPPAGDATSDPAGTSGPDRGPSVTASENVETPELIASRASNAQPTEAATTTESTSQPPVQTAAFADSAGPVILADASSAGPLTTAAVEVVDLPLETEPVVAHVPANRSSKWPPIVLGIAIASALLVFAHRRFRSGM